MVYVFFAEGFEEIEAIAPVDMLRRAAVEVCTVGVGGRQITGAHGIAVQCDITVEELTPDDTLEMVFLPGGMPGTKNLAASAAVRDAVEYADRHDKFVAAICAAPSALGDWGMLRRRSYTCYPGCQKECFGGEYTGAPITVDGRLLTGIGPGAALGFGRVMLHLLRGEEAAETVAGKMILD